MSIYIFYKMCSLCLKASTIPLKDLYSKDTNDLSFFDKISSSLKFDKVLEMNFEYKICKKCSETVDMIYNFNKSCLENIQSLSSYKLILNNNKKVETKQIYNEENVVKIEYTENTPLNLITVKPETLILSLIHVDENTVNNLDNSSDYETILVQDDIEEYLIFGEHFETDSANNLEDKIDIEQTEIKNESFNETEINLLELEEKGALGLSESHSTLLQPPSFCSSTENFSNVTSTQSESNTPNVAVEEHNKQPSLSELEVENKPSKETNGYLMLTDDGKSNQKEEQSQRNQNQLLIVNKNSREHKKYTCNECNKSFRHKCNWYSHLRTHYGIRSYICDVCKKSFVQKSHLKRHILTHTGEKSHICDVCNRSFRQKSHLRYHKMIHSGERPYVCNQCDKTYTRNSDLIIHKRLHSGEKPYVCGICSKTFTTKSYLTEHSYIHVGMKPHPCDICVLSFISRSKLNTHKKTHRHIERIA